MCQEYGTTCLGSSGEGFLMRYSQMSAGAAWMGLEDPLPMAHSHDWQTGAGWAFPQSYLRDDWSPPKQAIQEIEAEVTNPLLLLEVTSSNLHHTLLFT